MCFEISCNRSCISTQFIQESVAYIVGCRSVVCGPSWFRPLADRPAAGDCRTVLTLCLAYAMNHCAVWLVGDLMDISLWTYSPRKISRSFYIPASTTAIRRSSYLRRSTITVYRIDWHNRRSGIRVSASFQILGHVKISRRSAITML